MLFDVAEGSVVEKYSMSDILLAAREGNEDALLVLLTRCEPLINKYAKRGGFVDPDLKQHLIADWLHVIKEFDPLRYTSESEGADQP
jgi:hypothetical protein